MNSTEMISSQNNENRDGSAAPVNSMWFVGTHPPRRCGIATFTRDLRNAVAAQLGDAQARVISIDDVANEHVYDQTVELALPQDDRPAYRAAGDLLNVNRVDVVSIQHEFGIFGGDDGSHLLSLLGRLRMPAIVTLHTVLRNPTSGQRSVMNELIQQSARLVVLSDSGRAILRDVYRVRDSQIVTIPHGIPDLPFVDPHYFADQFEMRGKRVLLTFGLLGPGKGMELVIRALPKIVQQHPDVVYLILGATHPHVLRREGDRYRNSLWKLARELGVADNLQMRDEFVSNEMLAQYLGLAEIYIIPYGDVEQVCSGTLVNAIGAGKAVVSTPFLHAVELLGDDRGALFDFGDSDGLAEQVNRLLSDDNARNAMRKQAYLLGRSMIWPAVGKSYVRLAREVLQERSRGIGLMPFSSEPTITPAIDGDLNLEHLIRLSDDTGMLQHATFATAAREHGYCTDDNARALIAALRAHDLTGDPRMLPLADRYMAFLAHALEPTGSRFRNFMSYDRKWLDCGGSEDSHGRALWALATAVSLAKTKAMRWHAYRLFKRALTPVASFEAPHAWAFGILAMSRYVRATPIDAAVKRQLTETSRRLFDLFRGKAEATWPWPVDKLTYDNARLPQALILAGHDTDDRQMIDCGLESLKWLAANQLRDDGPVSLIGNDGWALRDGGRAQFDQQPLEIAAMVDACAAAHHATGDSRWLELARRFHLWFFGNNDLGLSLFDAETGGCCDGLLSVGVNYNQGAESTLALVQSSITIRELERQMEGSQSDQEQDAVA